MTSLQVTLQVLPNPDYGFHRARLDLLRVCGWFSLPGYPPTSPFFLIIPYRGDIKLPALS